MRNYPEFPRLTETVSFIYEKIIEVGNQEVE